MPAAIDGKKLCTKCNRKLSVDQFYRQSARRDGRMSSCKKCETNTGDLVTSGYNQKIYGATLNLFKERYGNG